MAESKPKKKIILFTIGNIDHPSSRIRGIQYIPYLEKAGYTVKWIPRIPEKPKNRFEKLFIFPFKKRVLSLIQILYALFAKPDLFLIQKVFLPKWVLTKIKSNRIHIIFDFDDAIYLNSDLVNIDLKLEQKTIRMIKGASKVIVSTKFLSDWCQSHGVHSTIITTPVDIYDIKKSDNEKLTIGWVGSITNTVHLEELREPLLELTKEFNIRLLLVGADTNFKIEGVDVVHKKWELSKEAEYLSKMDIGIMPLLKNNYSKGKGGYKIFVYMGAGLPVVATPIGINKDIVKDGITGYLANDEYEWKTQLTKLIKDKDLRETMGKNAKEIAKSLYSREICAKSTIKAINQLFEV